MLCSCKTTSVDAIVRLTKRVRRTWQEEERGLSEVGQEVTVTAASHGFPSDVTHAMA